jgi:hypothetical protein
VRLRQFHANHTERTQKKEEEKECRAVQNNLYPGISASSPTLLALADLAGIRIRSATLAGCGQSK